MSPAQHALPLVAGFLTPAPVPALVRELASTPPPMPDDGLWWQLCVEDGSGDGLLTLKDSLIDGSASIYISYLGFCIRHLRRLPASLSKIHALHPRPPLPTVISTLRNPLLCLLLVDFLQDLDEMKRCLKEMEEPATLREMQAMVA
ncbi:uncharacterized protein LOC120709185 isoform X1 [Panicum virgatum]|uniref:Uncharacterized protein n=1 Tax=Panicum virgatum TaxID=38727 RepID=A0A8T0XS08_PANVG|nr:uncharacterized protein LOC120709185 isoform X1 [Panicum virgatum]XP_039850674.1 uncharacterized protein LOC120709185 isoform X1 [Panicum virgatum]KAG2659934.1 hypothetical protein PVAP13_1KG402300 [Panicum virgatum]